MRRAIFTQPELPPALPSLRWLQLIPLCIRHRLFAALIAIFTRALRDHQTPAALLLVAAAAAAEAEEAAGAAGAAEPAAASQPQAKHAASAAAATEAEAAAAPDALLQRRESLRLAYKLLVFLRCCLLGQAYPPGVGGCGWGTSADGEHPGCGWQC